MGRSGINNMNIGLAIANEHDGKLDIHIADGNHPWVGL
jgi:hypothetical protein